MSISILRLYNNNNYCLVPLSRETLSRKPSEQAEVSTLPVLQQRAGEVGLGGGDSRGERVCVRERERWVQWRVGHRLRR